MFDYIYYDIFPYIFEFFSKLVGLASMPVGDFLESVALTGIIPYTNLLTGETSSYLLYGGWTPAQPILAGILAIMFGAVPSSAPLWVGMVLCCVQVYFAIAIVKFVSGLF